MIWHPERGSRKSGIAMRIVDTPHLVPLRQGYRWEGCIDQGDFPLQIGREDIFRWAAVLREAAQIDQLPFHSCRCGLTRVGIIGGNGNVLLAIAGEQLERSSPRFPAGKDVVIIYEVK